MKIGNIQIHNDVFLAPMAGITDLPFRMLCKEKGCGMVYTEMVSVKGLYYGGERTNELLDIHPDEHPIGAQIFGNEPELMGIITQRLNDTNIDIIDINMGCPAPKIVKNNEGCALMRDLDLAEKIIKAVVKAARKPVTVKFRKGWDDFQVNAVEFAKMAQDCGASAITVHGRTREQFYAGKADWEIIRQVKNAVDLPVIGNGDIFSAEAAGKMLDDTGCDGIMVARGAQGNPWIFAEIIHYLQTGETLQPPSSLDRFHMALRHTQLMVEYKGEKNAIREMRKHISWYLKNFKNAAEIRDKINHASSWEETREILEDQVKKLQ